MASNNYSAPPGAPPNWHGGQSNNPFNPQSTTQNISQNAYTPPAGPPPQKSHDGYASPPGKPPGYEKEGASDEVPAYQQHNWQEAVPDTTLYPPPPPLTNDFSTGANATWEDAERGKAWCQANPLWPAQQVSPSIVQNIHANNFTINPAIPFQGEVRKTGAKTWQVRVGQSCPDSCLMPDLPLYSALNDSPMMTERQKVLYFEVKFLSIGAVKKHRFRADEEIDAGVAVGFIAPPYPPFRLPGWQRASLGIHSDDGRRYVNDTDGGIDFTAPFQAGQTVGVGMKFSVSNALPSYGAAQGAQPLAVECFFTRNGRLEGTWDLYEERDADDGGVTGLGGDRDLFAAVGMFGASEFEIHFDQSTWLYRL